jgi:hypothetical protein
MEALQVRRPSRPLRGVTILGWIVVGVCGVELLVLAGVGAWATKVRFDQAVASNAPLIQSSRTLPAGFPADFPIYPRGTLSKVTWVGDGYQAQWATGDSADSVISFYRNALNAPPYVGDQEVTMGPLRMIPFTRADLPGFVETLPMGDPKLGGRTTIIAKVPTN